MGAELPAREQRAEAGGYETRYQGSNSRGVLLQSAMVVACVMRPGLSYKYVVYRKPRKRKVEVVTYGQYST